MAVSDDDKYHKKGINTDQGEDDEGESGQGGKSGQVEFHDFLAAGERLRDDLLPPDEKRRLLSVHNSTHELRVKDQKDRREQYKALKEGKVPLRAFREGLMNAGMSPYKANPELANKAQFSGRDRQVNTLPTDYIAETNNEKKEELRYEHSLQNRLEYSPTPKFNPKPTPR